MRQLEIGPGAERLPGFETLNIVRTPATDHVGDARNPPFEDCTFDLVYSSHCIEHIDWFDVEETIREWARILKPGGVLEVFTANGLALMKAIVRLEETGEWTGPDSYLTWRQDLVKADPYNWAVGRIMNYAKKGSVFHLHRAIITPGFLRRCFERAGLSQIEPMTNAETRGRGHGWINFGLRGHKC